MQHRPLQSFPTKQGKICKAFMSYHRLCQLYLASTRPRIVRQKYLLFCSIECFGDMGLKITVVDGKRKEVTGRCVKGPCSPAGPPSSISSAHPGFLLMGKISNTTLYHTVRGVQPVSEWMNESMCTLCVGSCLPCRFCICVCVWVYVWAVSPLFHRSPHSACDIKHLNQLSYAHQKNNNNNNP